MPQHGTYLALGSSLWKSGEVAASELKETDGWKFKNAGYFLKDISRSFEDADVNYCDIHITVNCSNGDRIRDKYKLNCPHVTFDDGTYKTHVYYNFSSDGSQLVYQYTDNTTDKVWREAAYLIISSDTGWSKSVLNPFQVETAV